MMALVQRVHSEGFHSYTLCQQQLILQVLCFLQLELTLRVKVPKALCTRSAAGTHTPCELCVRLKGYSIGVLAFLHQ